MSRHATCARASVWIAAVLLAAPSPATEPWTDPGLPVRESLELWLDARRIAPAADGEPPSESVSQWHDGSGRGRHLVQSSKTQQPRRVWEAPAANSDSATSTDSAGHRDTVVSFDGVDDWLGWSQPAPGLAFETLTVLAVVAPRSNLGGYRGILSASARGTNDYVTGLNIDLGQAGRGALDWLNVEGAGFGGERDVLGRTLSLGSFHVFALAIGGERVQLRANGQPAGERPRKAGAVRMDDIRLGARWYDNSQPYPGPRATGFLDGSVAELVFYGRELEAQEILEVEHYLQTKHQRLLNRAPPLPPEPVRFLAPGFEVRELPLEMTNVNAVQYDDRGRLFALGYDGRVRVLQDTDGDGLEDAAREFFDGPPVIQPVSMLVTADGVFVSGGKAITKFVDDDGDAQADLRETVIQDWTPSTNYSGGVDSLGLAMDADGGLYFGLGCDDFTNAYRVVDGKSLYSLQSPRGTIQKLPRGGKKSETVCTGIRFPMGLAFNAAGDLFCTDQEGETWLPGGNPLDELNHIIPGRHYGFPPQHNDYLPQVRDEPPVVGFSPQHQSTCGLKFNDKRWGQKPFGPSHWHGDALVCGYSRGKLWRVSLTKTDAGYVGRETLIAACRMLLVDVAVSPAADLVLACHGGAPDWGTGPQGKGKLFQVRYADKAAPQPVLAWAKSPTDVQVAFDRPLDDSWRKAAEGAQIEYGEHVRPADRDEALKPGYDAVRRQLESPRHELRVVGAALTDDRLGLVLRTDPHPVATHYAVRLPLPSKESTQVATAALDIGYALPETPGQRPAISEIAGSGAVDAAKWQGTLPRLETQGAASDSAPELTGGDWERGRQLFFGQEAKCSACHTLRGDGTKVGPDLTNLVHRDPASVLRDITQPSAAINPEFVPFALHTKDGRTLTGLVRAEADGKLRITNGEAQQHEVATDDVEEMSASSVSIMPQGMEQKLGADGLRDLLTFLLIPAAQTSEPIGVAPPPQRTPEELAALALPAKTDTNVPPKPLRILLVWGHKDHGPGEHDYPRWRAEWSQRLAGLAGVSVRTALNWPTADQWATADVAILYHFHQDYNAQRLAELDAFLAQGRGLAVLHSATVSGNPEALAQRIGLAAKAGPTKYRHGPTELHFTNAGRGLFGVLPSLPLVDETYWPLIGDPSLVSVLATAQEEGRDWPMLWTYRRGPGRVFGCIMGHYYWTLDDPVFRTVWLRGTAWAAGAAGDRFDPLRATD